MRMIAFVTRQSQFYPRFFSHSSFYQCVIRGGFLILCSNEQISRQSNDRKNAAQSETITHTVSLPVWAYILEYPPVSVEKTTDARSVSIVNRFKVCINQIVLRQDI